MHAARPLRPFWIATMVAIVLALAAPALTSARTTVSPTAAARATTAPPATARATAPAATARAATAPAARARAASAPAGSLIGLVTAPTASGAAATLPAADVRVTATAANGTAYATVTTASGAYDLEQLPAGTYSVATSAPPSPAIHAIVRARTVTTENLALAGPVATITGVVRVGNSGPVPGIPVSLTAPGAGACTTAPACGTEVASGAKGRYTLHVPAGTYSLTASDAGVPTATRPIVARAGATAHAAVELTATPVPTGTTAHRAARDLGWLDAERSAAGLPAGLTLAHRWSAECAAHDAYERLNGVLSPTETSGSPGASTGGAWAGLNSDLAEGRWTRGSTPWEDAPIHLLALLAPSLKVVGIDDEGGFQCVTTYPGMLRAPTATDRIVTYPAAGAKGVQPSETARESPFVPGQFVGLPNGHATGRELFVYLNLAHQIGQAPVHVLAARLATAGHPVAVRRVDTTTPTVGRYLAGAILIPVAPMRPHARYTATVKVQDRAGTLTRSWSFSTS